MALDALNPDLIHQAAQTLKGSAQPEGGQKEPIKVGQRYYPARQLVQQAAKLSGLKGASKLTAQEARILLEELGFGEGTPPKQAKPKVRKPQAPAKAKVKAPKQAKQTSQAPTTLPKAQTGPKMEASVPVAVPVDTSPAQQEPAATQIRRRLAEEPLQHSEGCFGLVLGLVMSVIALLGYSLL